MNSKHLTLFTILLFVPLFIQAQFGFLDRPLFQKRTKAEMVFASVPTETGKVPKEPKTKFTTAEPIYGVLKLEKPLREIFTGDLRNGMRARITLYAGNKKLGNAESYYTERELSLAWNEKNIPIEIIPDENTLQYHLEYANLLENIAKLKPEVITVKAKRQLTIGEATFTLDATNIAKDKERLLRIAERIRENNKKGIKEINLQRDAKTYELPKAGMRDAALEGKIRVELKAIGINPTHIIIQDTGWTVFRNELTGIPEYKAINVTYTWKKDGECWVNYGIAYQNYLGGGRYDKVGVSGKTEDRLIDCKEIK